MDEKENILIIDDNSSITNLTSRFLTSRGYLCTVSNDGRNGLTLLKSGKFNLTLLDIAMPDYGGLDIIEDLEKNDLLKNNKIILYTASSISNEEIDDLQKRGVHSCLKKPVGIQELLQTIETALFVEQKVK